MKRAREIFCLLISGWIVSCAGTPGVGVMSFDPGSDSSSTTVLPVILDPLLVVPLSVIEAAKNHRHQAITGRCLCHASSENNIGTLCPNLTVKISNSEGRELSRTITNGDFAFRGQPKVAYQLSVVSDKYGLETTTPGNVYVGEDVVLNLAANKSRR
jgi:hypothetical protein